MILITGGAGYIGSQLVNELRNDQELKRHEIVVFDSLRGRFDYFENPERAYSVYCNLDKRFSNISLVTGDIRRNTHKLQELVERADYVFHLAAVTGASYSNDNKKLYWDTIFDGTLNIFEAAKSSDLEALINISSCNIYGRSPEKELTEDSELNPINTYAKAKASAEKLISERAKEGNVSVRSLRLATNFGNQNPELGGTRYNLVINKFVKQALEEKPLTPYGNGKNWRPFMHVVDSARMIKEIAKKDAGPGEVYNSGFSEMNFRINEIADKVKKIIEEEKNLTVDIEYKRERDPGPSYRVDFSKIQRKLDLEKKYDLESGIRGLIEHYDRDRELEEGWAF